MCGIAGQIRLKQDLAPLKALDIEKMCEAMRHRGPDDQGIRLWKNVGFGFRRLAIIDLSTLAHQPMCNEDESLWLIFNGEIYNYKILRQELMDAGHTFHSQSDSEVILHGFEAWGVDLLPRLEGMFAFALYQPAKNYLMLARDPFGIKPLYYLERSTDLFFASEVKALLTLDGYKPKLNVEALPSYLTLGYVPTPQTMFSEIRKLPPGHFLEIKHGAQQLKRYFDLTQAPTHPSPESAEAIAQMIDKSVVDSMVSDVPLGVFLSGGLDSTLLTLYAAKKRRELGESPLKTFSIGFADYPRFDETGKSDYVAKLLGTDHHSLIIREEASTVLNKVVRALEEPLADPSIIPTYHLAAMTKSFVTVALSGEGGDELLGGYNRYYWEPKAGGVLGQLGALAAPLLLPFLKHYEHGQKHGISNLGRRAAKFLNTASLKRPERYLNWFALLPLHQLGQLLTHADGRESALKLFEQLLSETKFLSPLQQLQYVDIRTMLLDNLLLKADKIGMAHSLEMRVPLLNPTLAKQLFYLKDSLKLQGSTTKFIERQILAETLGENFVNQPKQGFEVPIGAWLRQQGKALLQDNLSAASFDSKLFSQQAVQMLVDEHLQGKRDYGLALFSLIMLSRWLKEFNVGLP